MARVVIDRRTGQPVLVSDHNLSGDVRKDLERNGIAKRKSKKRTYLESEHDRIMRRYSR